MFDRSFKFYCPKKFQKNWLSGLFKNSEKPCLGLRLFGFTMMKVNNTEGGLQYFIQQMAPYIIFEIKLSTIQGPYSRVAYLWYHRPKNYKFQK